MKRAPRKEATALVVDDDVVLRAALAELLEGEGFLNVIQASNGFSGLRLAFEHHPQVVLLDLLLPELSGTDVLHELRNGPGARELAIVVVTGIPESLSAAQLAAIDGVVSKPFDVDYLLATVKRAIQRAASRAAEVQPVTPAPTQAGHRRVEQTQAKTGTRRARRHR
jgi:CheY-like chemotaxis protein